MSENEIENKLINHINSAFAMIKTANEFIKTINDNKFSSKAVSQSIFELTVLCESLYESAVALATLQKIKNSNDYNDTFQILLNKNEIQINNKMRAIVEIIRNSKKS